MPTNVNVTVAGRRNTAASDQSFTSQDSHSLESSNPTSPLEPDQIPYRSKGSTRTAPRGNSISRGRPQSVAVEDYDEKDDFVQDPQPLVEPAPEPPGARLQKAFPPSRESSVEREREKAISKRERRQGHKHQHHKKRHLRDPPRSPSETTTEEMDRQNYVNEQGHVLQYPQYSTQQEYMSQQQYPPPQSNHPSMVPPNNQLVQLGNPYHQHGAMYQQGGYPQQQQGFYPPSMPQSPGMPMMPQQYFPWGMMGGMQPQQQIASEPSQELLLLKREVEENRQREKRAYEDAERAKHEQELERVRREADRKDREDQARAQEAAVAKALSDFKKSLEEEAARAKALEDAKSEVKKSAGEAAKKTAEKKEEEHKKKLDEATAEMEKFKKEAEAAKKEAETAKGPPENSQKVHIELCAANMKSKKFHIPFGLSKSWKSLHPLLIDAYRGSDDRLGNLLATRFEDGHFDITGPEGTTMMSNYWDLVIKPEMDVKVTVRIPEPLKPTTVKVKHGEASGSRKRGELSRSKSHRERDLSKRQSRVMFGELPSSGAVPPAPPPAPQVPTGGIEVTSDDEIVAIEDGSNDGSVVGNSSRKKKGKENQRTPGVMDILLGRRPRSKK